MNNQHFLDQDARGPSSADERWYRARVQAVDRENPSTVTVRFSVEGQYPTYFPGQYAMLRFVFGSTEFRRAYSFSSLSTEKCHAMTIRAVFDGKVSTYVNEHLAEGASFDIGEPIGAFAFPESAERVLLVAGGAGISPFYAMLKHELVSQEGPAIELVYFSRYAKDLIFVDALRQWANSVPRFRLHVVLTREQAEVPDCTKGSASIETLQNLTGLPTRAHYLLCGAPEMVDRLLAALLEQGVPQKRLHTERFSFAARPVAHDGRGQVVVVRRKGLLWTRRKAVRTRAGEPLLAATRRAGYRLRGGCRVGSCGSCKVRLVSGRVAMDEPNCLTPQQASAGYVLSCVGYPLEKVEIEIP